MRKGLSPFTLSCLMFGFAFLYVPILLLVVYSFNDGKNVAIWSGFSTRWYATLLENEALKAATWVTLQVAVASSTLAVMIGTLAGVLMARFGHFRGRTVFSAMVYAPLVMPEVIIGLSLLLLFVSLSIDRGFMTVTIAHTTTSAAYVAVVIQSRLSSFDRSIEEAALDLGATPAKTFFVITLPVIAPALVAGWLLAFTLSLDALVLSQFTTGPGSTTLPMQIYSKVRLGVTPEINAISTILIGVVATGVLIASILQHRAVKRREREEREALAT
ncbi:ABC transporter permease subunit [Zavarzinia sp. CC-PAN008]|uniref:ABC transporter permease subunit n=1 Tax=Zavarzinia sp. CC-PAN008 TaxID=3243332 RepID=UPI003F749033